jgi:hypothetical protein
MIDESSVSSDTIIIYAPAQIVWDVIVDFENYNLWNPFCPQVTGELELGAALTMQVDLGQGLQEQVERITRMEPGHVIVWSMENKPGDPIHADRIQRIEAIDDVSCTYITIDEFSGESAGGILEHFGPLIEAGFNRCALGLKARAENLFRLQQAAGT